MAQNPEGITNDDVTRLAKAFAAAEKLILSQIRGKDLNDRRDKQLLLAQIQAELQKLVKPAIEFTDQQARFEYNEGLKEVDRAFQGFGGGITGGFSLINPDAALAVIRSLDDVLDGYAGQVRSVLANAYANIEKTMNELDRNWRAEVLEKIAKGQITGRARSRISNELADYLEEKGFTGVTIIDKNGRERNYSLDSYVERLTRATLIDSHATAVVQRTLERGYDLVRVSRHATPSPMCEPYQGMIVSITGQTPGYKTLGEITFKGDYSAGGGIFHPRCRHSLTVYFPD